MNNANENKKTILLNKYTGKKCEILQRDSAGGALLKFEDETEAWFPARFLNRDFEEIRNDH